MDVVHIVGGGSQNRLLCQLTADATGKRVIAGPVEATALGNVLVQARAAGAVCGGLADLRRTGGGSHGAADVLVRAAVRGCDSIAQYAVFKWCRRLKSAMT